MYTCIDLTAWLQRPAMLATTNRNLLPLSKAQPGRRIAQCKGVMRQHPFVIRHLDSGHLTPVHMCKDIKGLKGVRCLCKALP